MTLKKPTSMKELVYFTRRTLRGGKGSVMVWVFRENCPKCNKGLMGKPINEKTGKVKTRAKEYICPECGYTVEKQEYEDSLTANIKYTCPHCGFAGEKQIPFKRKKVTIIDSVSQKKKRVEALVFECEKCKEKIEITKKMKGE